MRGHVFNRGASWYYQVTIGMKQDGRRDQRKKGGFATRRDAQEALTLLLKGLQDGTYLRPTKETVGEFFTRWLPSVRHSVRPTTWDGYEYLTRKYIVPNIGTLKLAGLTHVRLNTLYADLLQSGGKNGRPLSPKTVRNIHILLRRALRDAELPFNPAAKASPPRLMQRDLQTWDAPTLQAFLERARGHRDYIGWLLLAATGMRRGEVLNLQWADIDFNRGTLSIEQSKTAAGRRLIAMDENTLNEIREWRKANLHTTYVVSEADGMRCRPQAFTERFRARVRAWSFPVIRLHDLRHTHASLLLAKGVHPKVVQERLGHSSVQITLDIYSHLTRDMQDGAAEAVRSLLWAPQSG